MTISAFAHCGDPVRERENTLPAFTAVAALGADIIELDLRCTRDGHIVVLPVVDRPGILSARHPSCVDRDAGRP